jgi:hypothetical protein
VNDGRCISPTNATPITRRYALLTVWQILMLFGVREQKNAVRSTRKSRSVTKRLNLQFLDLFGNACHAAGDMQGIEGSIDIELACGIPVALPALGLRSHGQCQDGEGGGGVGGQERNSHRFISHTDTRVIGRR